MFCGCLQGLGNGAAGVLGQFYDHVSAQSIDHFKWAADPVESHLHRVINVLRRAGDIRDQSGRIGQHAAEEIATILVMRLCAFDHHGQGFEPILLRIGGFLCQGRQFGDAWAQRAAGQIKGLILAIKPALA